MLSFLFAPRFTESRGPNPAAYFTLRTISRAPGNIAFYNLVPSVSLLLLYVHFFDTLLENKNKLFPGGRPDLHPPWCYPENFNFSWDLPKFLLLLLFYFIFFFYLRLWPGSQFFGSRCSLLWFSAGINFEGDRSENFGKKLWKCVEGSQSKILSRWAFYNLLQCEVTNLIWKVVIGVALFYEFTIDFQLFLKVYI